MRLLIGTHTFAATGDSARRQASAVAALGVLADVDAVNVQLASAPHHASGLETLAVLQHDAPRITGQRGLVKPVMSEMFDALAGEAAKRGLSHFAFVNGDIVVLPAAVERILGGSEDALIACRMDTDRDGAHKQALLTGQDLYAFRTDWWFANRRRFRPYVTAEGVWDNVYTSIALCHGRSQLVTRTVLILHEDHPSAPTSAYARYTQRLAAKDSWYFSRWAKYVWAVWAARGRGDADEATEIAMQRQFFHPPGLPQRGLQAARGTWWTLRQAVSGA